MTVIDRLTSYLDHIKGTQKIFLSEFTPGTSRASRKPMAKNCDKKIETKVTGKNKQKKAIKCGHKHLGQEKYLTEITQDHWSKCNPIGTLKKKEEISTHNNCHEDTVFSRCHLASAESHSEWSN